MCLPFSLQLIVNRASPERELEPLLWAGVDCLHVRIAGLLTRDLLDQVQRTVGIARKNGATVLVNGRIDIALASGADGVHLPRHGVSPAEARPLMVNKLIGVSAHSVEEAVAAGRAGANFVTFGHVFSTRSHPDEAPRGLEQLRSAIEAVRCPVVAIGGIRPDNVASVREAGASGIAVIGSVWKAVDPVAAVRQLKGVESNANQG